MERKELYVGAGQGQVFAKISEALDAARQFQNMEIVIHIAPGTYKERLEIKQNHVSFIGTDAEQTKITYSDGALDFMPKGTSGERFVHRVSLLTQIIFMPATFLSAMRRDRDLKSGRLLRYMRTATTWCLKTAALTVIRIHFSRHRCPRKKNRQAVSRGQKNLRPDGLADTCIRTAILQETLTLYLAVPLLILTTANCL